MGFKRCSACKDIWYCGTACHNADWKLHKKKCTGRRPVLQESPVLLQEAAGAQDSPVIQDKIPLRQAMDHIITAQELDDWRGVLKFAGRM